MAVVPKSYVRLNGSERKPSPGARLLGPADEHETFTVTIAIRRRPDGEPLPDYDYFLKTPPSQRRRLSSGEFAAKYGAAADDLRKVIDFASGNGLKIVESNQSRRTVVVSGTVAQMKKAFAVELGRYEHEVFLRRGDKPQTETYRGRDGFIHIPKDLDGIVVGVFGLDNRRITKRAAADPPPPYPTSVPQVTQLYSFPPNLAAGQTIAILSEDGYRLTDLHLYNATLPPGYFVPDPTDVTVRGPGNLGFDPVGETTQDISIAGAAARGAAIAVYFTTYDQVGWMDLILRVVHPEPGDPICSVLSTSFYVSNGDDAAELARESVTYSWLDAVSAALRDAAVQGVTFCTVSGDYGVDTSAYGGAISDGKQHVVYPGSDPWALCCGGTTIGNISGSSFDEYVWNDTAFGQQWATGGGVSDFFNVLPSYQVNAGVPVSIKDGHVGRGVPDVAANASVNSGYPIILNGAPSVGDGTSAAAPLWAGLIAILNAALGDNLGFVNPALYALGSSVFRDILGAPGPATNGINGVPGYPAGPGWDACTGWGSPKGTALLQGLKHFYGPAIVVNLQDDLRFGTRCHVPAFLNVEVFNVGTQDLFVTSVSILGSPDFQVLPNPMTPLAIAPGDHVDFTVEYHPATHIGSSATIQIVSDDPVTPILDLPTSGLWGAGALETIIADRGDFGEVCLGSFVDRPLELNNNGPCPVRILNVLSFPAEFETPSVIAFPLVVSAGVSISLPIRFKPSSLGATNGTITIVSDDPLSPQTVKVYGTAGGPRLVLGIADDGNFGHVCVGSFVDEPLFVNNSGKCTLWVNSITSSSSDFLPPGISSYPIAIGPGDSALLTIRFQPTNLGPTPPGTLITVDSNDPAGPRSVRVSGYAPAGKLSVTGSVFFGGVRACCREERTIPICNVGDCKLVVSSVAFKRKSRHWKLINNPFPATLHPGSCLSVAVLYKATEKYPRSCDLIVTSDDPATPVRTVELLATTIWDDCGCRKCCENCQRGQCEKRHCDPCRCKCNDDQDDEEGDGDDGD